MGPLEGNLRSHGRHQPDTGVRQEAASKGYTAVVGRRLYNIIRGGLGDSSVEFLHFKVRLSSRGWMEGRLVHVCIMLMRGAIEAERSFLILWVFLDLGCRHFQSQHVYSSV